MHDVREVTIVMTTYNNNDFTKASIWSIRRYYPEITIILTDGGSEEKNYFDLVKFANKDKKIQIMQFIGGSTEECRNIAATAVETDYVLFMDNDVKIIDKSAIPILLDVLEKEKVVQTGAYGIKIADWGNIRAYVGSEFIDYMEIDASPAYFSMHKTHIYKEVGGMPKKWFYNLPQNLIDLWNKTFENLGKSGPGYTGDLTITTLYKGYGWRAMSPKETVPVIHWSQANKWFTDYTQNRELETWWHNNIKHIRCAPLNNWKLMEKKDWER